MPSRRIAGDKAPVRGQSSQPLTTVLTLPNVISFLRLLLIPIFFVLLMSDVSHFYAFIVFSVAAATDWIDGQVARRTNTVSKFGQVLDPFIDRLLIASGLIGIFIMHRIPLWVVILLISRDVVLLSGTLYFNIKTHGKNVPVIYLGKVTTTLLFVGFASLLINWPIIGGIGIANLPYLPGFGDNPFALGIWFVYVGILFSLSTAVIYFFKGRTLLRNYQEEMVSNQVVGE